MIYEIERKGNIFYNSLMHSSYINIDLLLKSLLKKRDKQYQRMKQDVGLPSRTNGRTQATAKRVLSREQKREKRNRRRAKKEAAKKAEEKEKKADLSPFDPSPTVSESYY